MTGFAVLAVIAAATWVVRITLLVLVPAGRFPPAVRAAFDDLAPAVLTAIVAVDLVSLLTEEADPLSRVETFVAVGLVGAVAWRTRSLAVTAVLALLAVGALDVVLG